jgi:Tol biopolymer transport system component
MGEVFKARDTRLNRLVALKIIAHERQDLEESRQRFASEGRAIAALNHPHICALYDTGFERGRPYLVMEYLEGETLAARLARGRLPLRDAIGLAIEIADALDFAHRHGIVHRDLKPANVFIARSGGAKLLDFGLSAMRGATDATLAKLATEPVRLTAEGAIVGTLHYLAPERLDGRDADARSDIYAFGAVLYEMLSGKRPFDEPTQARLIGAILRGEPPALDPAAGIPPELQTVQRVALARNPDDRWQSIGDVSKMLKAVAGRGAPPSAEQAGRRGLSWPILIPSVAAAVLAVAIAVLILRPDPPADTAISFYVPPPPDGVMGLTDSSVMTAQFAVSPDGRTLVFVGTTDRKRRLWIRQLDSLDARPMTGTEGASHPFWSADGKHIGFFAGERLKRTPVSGGPPTMLCQAKNGRGGAWNGNGDIVFAPDNNTVLHRITADGVGAPQPIGTKPANHGSHRWPQFLPDGRHLLFLVSSNDANVEGIYLTSLAAPGEARKLQAASSNGLYASGYLLYVVDGALLAQRLDPASGTLSGDGIPLRLQVSSSSTLYSAFAVSEAGVLATWAAGEMSELVWFDRGGKRLGAVNGPGHYIDFRLSPDDSRLAFARVDGGTGFSDLWVVDLVRDNPARIASAPKTDASPIWSPKGDRIVFRSNRRSTHELFERPSHPGGDDIFLFGSGDGTYPTDWSADGGTIAYHERHRETKYDISFLDRATKKPKAVISTEFDEAQGQLAADGRLAYTSDASEDLNVYVTRPFGSEGTRRVSTPGGFDPRWRQDGRELFYLSDTGDLTVVEFPKGGLTMGRVTSLFSTGITPPGSPYPSHFVPTSDGKRFLIKVPIQRADTRAIAVTLDWRRRLAPGS